MSALLELCNRLLAQALAEQAHAGALRVRSVALDGEGARIVVDVRPPAGEGELVLRLRAEPAQGERQDLLLTLEQPPAHWGAGVEPLRRVLERARLRLELDFTP